MALLMRAANDTAGGTTARLLTSRGGLVVALVALILLLCAAAWTIALDAGTRRLAGNLDDRLRLTLHAVESEIERYRYLPGVLGHDERIRAVLDPGPQAGATDAANRYLETVRDTSGADELYVLDATGRTLAASNWNEPGSFVGNNYGFRPYFTGAMSSGAGRYYAVGVTTGKPGYFLSTRLAGATGSGVVVAKVDMAGLERAWLEAGELTGLADGAGVVFLTGNAEWKYRPLAPLSQSDAAAIVAERRYEGVDVLNAAPIAMLPNPFDSGGEVASGRGPLLIATTVVEPDGWTLFSALPLRPVHDEARLLTGLAALAGLLAAAVTLFILQRRQLTHIRLEQNVLLEQRVAERTQALAHEIGERERTEAELRTAQDNLIHTARLAALGQMSAAIAHEVSQPLSAMENTLAAAAAHAERAATDEVQRNLRGARDLVRRMQRMVKHLRSFSARRDPRLIEPVDVAATLSAAIEIVSARARDLGIAIVSTPPVAPLPAVAGDPARLEQVFINVLMNAIDATYAAGSDMVTTRLAYDRGAIVVVVADRGTGIADDVGDRVFEPFFTTKTTGEGLGLGLSITRTILEDHKGSLRFDAAPGGGIEAVVTLPVGAVSAREVEPALV